jgi:hypothetical protein
LFPTRAAIADRNSETDASFTSSGASRELRLRPRQRYGQPVQCASMTSRATIVSPSARLTATAAKVAGRPSRSIRA